MKTLLLASQSPRRHELLALLGLPFEVLSPNIVEAHRADEPPPEVAARLSLTKARAAWRIANRTLTAPAPRAVIACDTVVALNGRLLGKPRDEDEAGTMLRQLRARAHIVYSAFTILDTTTDQTLTEVAETIVMMRAYTDAEIAGYVASGDPMDKAGAYAIQHSGFHPVTEVRGCYTNVVGLPLCHLARHLYASGHWPGRSRRRRRPQTIGRTVPTVAGRGQTVGTGRTINVREVRRARVIRSPRDVPAACQAHTNRRCAVYTAILNGECKACGR